MGKCDTFFASHNAYRPNKIEKYKFLKIIFQNVKDLQNLKSISPNEADIFWDFFGMAGTADTQSIIQNM